MNVCSTARATRHAETIDQHVTRLAALEHTSALRGTMIEVMQDRLISKAAKDSVVELRQRLEAFSNIEHVTTLKDVMLPRLEAFSDQVETFQADHIEMKECI
jgi:isocitrate/isopropylmalate dehydrogenase